MFTFNSLRFTVLTLLGLCVCGGVFGQKTDESLRSLHKELAAYHAANGIDDSNPLPIPTSDAKVRSAANDIQLLKMVDVIANDKELAGQLELMDDQRMIVNDILSQYHDLKAGLARSLEQADESHRFAYEIKFRRDCRQLSKQLSETLVNFQTLELLDARLGRGGLLELLTTPNIVANHVNLSATQKKKLTDKYEELGKEIEDFIKKKRLEASAIFADELSKVQKEKLIQLLGAEVVSQSFEHASSGSLMSQSGIKTKEQFGPNIDEWRDIEKGLHKDR